MLLNARSIRDIHKLNELELTVNEKKIDLIALTESWLEDAMTDSEPSITGYTIFRKDRKQVRDLKGGGVLLYLWDCFNAYYETELNDLQNESLWIRIQQDPCFYKHLLQDPCLLVCATKVQQQMMMR